MTTHTVKVAPPNPHKSKYPRLTHKIALAGGKDFYNAKVKFGLQVRPEDSKYPAIRVNTKFWRLRYTLEVDGQPIQVVEYKDEGAHLSERLARWKAEDKDRRSAIAELSLADGQSMSTALRDIRSNGSLYAVECTMATAIVRLFVSRRGVIGTKAKFEEKQEADKHFDDLYPTMLVEPLKGNIKVPGLSWLLPDSLPLFLAELRTGTSAKVHVGDWIYFTHPFFPRDDPFRGENALWLGERIIYAHDYGMVSVDQYLTDVRQHDPSISLRKVRQESTVNLQLVGK